MKPIVIYTKDYCPFCLKAKQLLTAKGAAFKEIEITNNPALKEEMMSKAGGRHTVPQIFIGEEHIGGCDDLVALDKAGGLEAKIA